MLNNEEQLFSWRNWGWAVAVALMGLLFWFLPPIAAEQDAVYRSFTPLLTIKSHIQKRYVEPLDDAVLIEGAIRGMIRELDPFSDYLSPRDYPVFMERMHGGYVGIGVRFDPSADELTVASPLEDSPAFRSGVRKGDIIVEISGSPVDRAKGLAEAERLRGVEGSVAHFAVRRPPDGKRIPFAVRREHIRTRSVRGFRRRDDRHWDFMIDPGRGIGYLRISDFWDNTLTDFNEAIADLQTQKVQALILDVRSNPGGDMSVACGLVDRFIDEGAILMTKNRLEVESVVEATAADTLPAWPLVVLVNGGSASGAEILAGALQDHERATIVGERTFGKGSVQTIIELGDGHSALRLTTAYYYLPKGRLIHRRPGDTTGKWGIDPDVVVSLSDTETAAVMQSWSQSTVIENAGSDAQQPILIDAQLAKALEWLHDDGDSGH